MPLTLTLRVGEAFFLGQNPIILDQILKDASRAVLLSDDSLYEVCQDRMTEVSPSAYVCLGRRAGKGVGAVSVVIDAPKSINIGRAPQGMNVPVVAFRNYEWTLDAENQGRKYGFSCNGLREMARLSAPLAHIKFNRRFEDYVMRIQGNRVEEFQYAERPKLQEMSPRMWAPWAEHCSICRGSLVAVQILNHAECKGRGCLKCEAGVLRIEKRCLAGRRNKAPVCSDILTSEVEA